MSTAAYAPLGSPTTEYLGAGAIYFDYGLVTEAVIGATKGGSNFTDNLEVREREADGDYTPVKNAIDITKIRPELTVNALKLDKTNLVKYFGGMALDDTDSTYSKLTRTLDMSSSYITNVAFVGQNRAGLDIIIILYNAIGLNALVTAITKDEEIVPEVIFTGTADPDTFDRDDKDTYPYQVWFEKAADTTAPTVTVVPVDAATSVSVDTTVVWTFNEAIKKSGVKAANFFLMEADGTAVDGALTVNAAGTEVTFTPTSSLTASTAHIAICTTNVTDLAGNALAAIEVTNFTTA
jgi:hypothetical protein